MSEGIFRRLGKGRFLEWEALEASRSTSGVLMVWDKRSLEVLDGGHVLCLIRVQECGRWFCLGFHRGLWAFIQGWEDTLMGRTWGY